MPKAMVGQIWRVSATLLALVVCVWEEDGNGEDIRIVPLSRAGDMPLVFTDRDVRISGLLRAAPVSFVAHAWLAQSMTSSMLLAVEGTVSSEALASVRNAELVGLAPDAEQRDRTIRGQVISGPNDGRIELMRILMASVTGAIAEAHARQVYVMLITKAQYSMRRMDNAIFGATLDVARPEEVLPEDTPAPTPVASMLAALNYFAVAA